MAKPTVIEVDFCYSFGKATFQYEYSRRMVNYEPDPEIFTEPPRLEPDNGSTLPNQKTIKRQIRHAFHQAAGTWGAVYALSLTLLDLVSLADKYVQAKNWPEAVMLYHNIITETLDNQDLVDDHEGDLATVISRCAAGLHHCFKAITDTSLRQTILDTLVQVSCWDVDEYSVKLID